MSLSERGIAPGHWRRHAALALALGLGGCFQPLYGEAAHPGIVADMRAIAVAPIKTSSRTSTAPARIRSPNIG